MSVCYPIAHCMDVPKVDNARQHLIDTPGLALHRAGPMGAGASVPVDKSYGLEKPIQRLVAIHFIIAAVHSIWRVLAVLVHVYLLASFNYAVIFPCGLHIKLPGSNPIINQAKQRHLLEQNHKLRQTGRQPGQACPLLLHRVQASA